MRRVQIDKIASVTVRLGLEKNAVLGDEIPAVEGTVVAARVKNAKTTYNTLEDVHGRMVQLYPGDIIAGALGHRDALYGFSGYVPEAVKPGDELNVLNLGGVIGASHEGQAESSAVDEALAFGDTERIADLLTATFNLAEQAGISTHEAAVRLAKEKIRERKKSA